MPANINQQLNKIACKVRQDILRMTVLSGSGHIAGSFSITDVLVTLYFSKILRFDPKRPNWDKRDYFLLSNGHTCPALYAVLARSGFFDVAELDTYAQLGSRLQGHPHFAFGSKDNLPGLENTSGSLGQGISQAAGIAWAMKMDGKNNQVFCMMSDGEQQEGQVWEAYTFINYHHLDNFIGIIDCNNIQISGPIKKVMPLRDLKLKLMSFGFRVLEADAHDFADLEKKLTHAKENKSQATIILASSLAGKGVSFMENDSKWHSHIPSENEYSQAIKELQIKEKSDVK